MENVVLLCDQPLDYKWIENSLNKEGFKVLVKSDLEDLNNDVINCNYPTKIIVNTISSNSGFHKDLCTIKKSIESKFNKKLLLAFYNEKNNILNDEVTSKYDLIKYADKPSSKKDFLEALITRISKDNNECLVSRNGVLESDTRKLERIFIKLTSINQLLNDFGKKYVKDIEEPLHEIIKEIDMYIIKNRSEQNLNLDNKFFDYREHIRECFSSLGFFNYEIKLNPNKINMLLDTKYGIAILDDILMACLTSSMNNKNISITEKISTSGLEIEFRFFCFEINIVKTKIRFAKKLLRLHGGDITIKYDITGSSIILMMPSYRIKN